MRISDWSSDVCSSDLKAAQPGRQRQTTGPGMKFVRSVVPRWDLSIAVPLMVIVLLLAGLWIIFQSEQNYRDEQRRAAHVTAEILEGDVTADLNSAAQRVGKVGGRTVSPWGWT